MSVLVGTAAGLVRLDGGTVERAFEDSSIDAIVDDGAHRWMLFDGTTVQRDTGAPILEGGAARLNCLLATGTELLIGADRARLFRLRTDEANGQAAEAVLDETFENAPGRDAWYTPWGGPPDVRSLAADADGTVYANVHVGGVLRLGVGGGWEATMDIDADAHQVAAHRDDAGLVVAATARGLAVSADGAATWTFVTDGLHANYCRAVAVSGDRVYVSAARNVRGSQAAIYRAERDGGSLERCRTGLPEWFSTNIDTGCVAADGDLVVIGDANGTVYRSEDAGASWAVVADGLARINCVTLATNS